MNITHHISAAATRLILPLIALGLVGLAVSANAAEHIFANGYEPCCTLGGEVSGLTGNGLVLHLAAGAISEDKPVPANGGSVRLYTFTRTAPPGTAYTVTIITQPASQTCTLSNANGTMAGTRVDNINATCVAGPANLVWNDGNWDDGKWQ